MMSKYFQQHIDTYTVTIFYVIQSEVTLQKQVYWNVSWVFSQDKDPRMLQLIIQRLGANVGDLHLNMTASYTPTNGGSAGMDSDATVNVLKFLTLFSFCSQTKC